MSSATVQVPTSTEPPPGRDSELLAHHHPRMEDDQNTDKPEEASPSKTHDVNNDMNGPLKSTAATKARRGAAAGIRESQQTTTANATDSQSTGDEKTGRPKSSFIDEEKPRPSLEPNSYAAAKPPPISKRSGSGGSVGSCTSNISMGSTTSAGKMSRGNNRKPGLRRGRSSDSSNPSRSRSTTPIRNKVPGVLNAASNHSTNSNGNNKNNKSRSTTPLTERGLSTRNAANFVPEEPSCIVTSHVTRQQQQQQQPKFWDSEVDLPPEPTLQTPPNQRISTSSSASSPPPTNLDRTATAATEAVDNTTRARTAAAMMEKPQHISEDARISSTQSAEPSMLAASSRPQPALLESPNQPDIPTRRPQHSMTQKPGSTPIPPPLSPNPDNKSVTSASTCAVDNTAGGRLSNGNNNNKSSSMLPPLPKFDKAVTSSAVTCAIDNTTAASSVRSSNAAATTNNNNIFGQQHLSSSGGEISKKPSRTESRGMSPVRSMNKQRGLSPQRPAGAGARGRSGLRGQGAEDDIPSGRSNSPHRGVSPKRNTTTADDIVVPRGDGTSSSGIQSSNHELKRGSSAANSSGVTSGTSGGGGTPPRPPGMVSRKSSGTSSDDAAALATAGLNLDRGISGDYGDIYGHLKGGTSEAFSDLSLNDSSANNRISGGRDGGHHIRRRNSFDDQHDNNNNKNEEMGDRNVKAKAALKRNNTFDGSDRRLNGSGGPLSAASAHSRGSSSPGMDYSSYSASSSRPSTASRPGAFSATGRGLRKKKDNDPSETRSIHSAATSRTSTASQVGVVAVKGRGLRKKSDEGGITRYLDDDIAGTAVPSNMVSKHRAARENAKAKSGGRCLSPAPGLRHNYAPGKDGKKLATNSISVPNSPIKEGMTLTFKTMNENSPSPTTLEPRVSAASTVVANQLLEEMVDNGLIPVLPELDPDLEKKRAGRIQFFGGNGGGRNSPVPKITELSKTLAEEAEADIVEMGSKPRRGNIVDHPGPVGINPVPSPPSNESGKKSSDGREQELVVHGSTNIVGDEQFAEQQRLSSGIRYDENGVAINSKNVIPPGYDRPGAYSGAPGNGYDRNVSLQFDLVNSDRTGQNAVGSSKSLGLISPGDIEEARSDEDDHDLKKGLSRRTLCIMGSLFAVVIVIVVIVVMVAGGGGSASSEEGTPNPENDPTEAPITVDFTASVLPTLTNTTIATETINAITEDPTSPQALAFAWMSEDPYLSNYSPWRRLQRFSLSTFYYSMNGPKWKASDEQARLWLDYESEHECSWLPYKNACNDAGQLQYLNITRLSKFSGTIPPQIVLLDHLYEIDLSNNILNTEYGLLFPQEMPPNLRILRCSQCRLKGTLPIEMGLMSSLQALVLSDNDIGGTLPSEIGLMTLMDSLLLNDNEISGGLPSEMGGMKRLINLYFDSNSLSGTIPQQLTDLPVLQHLGLGFNSFSGPVPSEIAKLTNLLRIKIQDNGFTGLLPSEIGKLRQLNSLDGSGCGLTGHIPSELGQLQALQSLILAWNSFSGTIPTQLGTARSLKVLDLDQNQLTGVVPSELGQLLNLEELLLGKNGLSGPLPSQIGALSTLTLTFDG